MPKREDETEQNIKDDERRQNKKDKILQVLIEEERRKKRDMEGILTKIKEFFSKK